MLAAKLFAYIHIELLSALIEVLANSLGSGDRRLEVFMVLHLLTKDNTCIHQNNSDSIRSCNGKHSVQVNADHA